MVNSPFVSIVVITYNQEDTLPQTLDSILNQNINFPIEIIIGEDYSTDNTREICINYQKKYPDIIRLILHEKNQGILKNYKCVIEACKGKYIAQCAGDDYWHNPNKLKIQTEFLENNPDYGVVHSDVDLFFSSTKKIKEIKRENIPNGKVFCQLIEEINFIYALTVMFRRDLLRYININEYIEQGFLMEDYPMWLELSNHTNFFWMNKSLSTYRVQNESASRSTSYQESVNFIESTFQIIKYFIIKYRPKINSDKLINKYLQERLKLAVQHNKKNDIIIFLKKIPGNIFLNKIKYYYYPRIKKIF